MRVGMKEFIINKNNNYNVISITHLIDKKLSLESKAVLSIMLLLPDNWDYSVNGLCEFCNTTKYEIAKVLKELETRKYLYRERMQNEKGTFYYVYQIFETPYTELPCTVNSGTDEHYININKHTNINISTNTNKNVEIPNINISTNINKNTYTNNISTSINTKEKEKINKKKKKENDANAPSLSELFDTIWKIYPRKIGKKKSYDYFAKAIKDGVDFDTIKNGVERYKQYVEKNKIEPSYIKHGSTWFNQQCWNDDYTIKNTNEPEWLENYANNIGNDNRKEETIQVLTNEELEELFRFKK